MGAVRGKLGFVCFYQRRTRFCRRQEMFRMKRGPVRLATSTGPARHATYLPKYGVQKLTGPTQVDCIAVSIGLPDDVLFVGTPP